MINANELRIGNWIADRGGKQWQIDSWESGYKVASKPPLFRTHTALGDMYGHPYTEELKYLEPITLTPEVLERCGFEWSIYHQAWHKEGFVFDLSERHVGWFFMHKSRLNSEIICAEILYLHQLQNLYFALTGQELKYNF